MSAKVTAAAVAMSVDAADDNDDYNCTVTCFQICFFLLLLLSASLVRLSLRCTVSHWSSFRLKAILSILVHEFSNR